MKLNELIKKDVVPAMPVGTEELTFEKFEIVVNNTKDQDIKGFRVYTKEYRSFYINWFNDGENYELDNLIDQLEVTSYDPEVINKAKGTKILVTRSYNQEFLNTSFRTAGLTTVTPDGEIPF